MRYVPVGSLRGYQANRRSNGPVRFAEIRVYQQEVIVVPILLLASFLVTIVFILLLRFCPEKVDRIRLQGSNRRALHGVDGRTLQLKRLDPQRGG